MLKTEIPVSVPFNVICPKCKNAFSATSTTNADPLVLLAPKIRGGIRPVGIPFEYHVTSEDIKKFINDVAHIYVPDAKLEISTRYCEKKQHRGEPHRSYAFFKIAFSHHVIQNYDEHGWFQQIGETGEHVSIEKDLFEHLIKRWQFNRKDLDSWLKSYKKMEQLEDSFGVSDEFMNDLKKFSTPRGIKVSGSGDVWVFFAASVEKILMDYFTNPDTKALAGKITVDNPTLISKDVIDYRITLNPYAVESTVNPHVQQILANDEKF
jgi:hypothetical protein